MKKLSRKERNRVYKRSLIIYDEKISEFGFLGLCEILSCAIYRNPLKLTETKETKLFKDSDALLWADHECGYNGNEERLLRRKIILDFCIEMTN